MAIKTIEQIRSVATTIKNEIIEHANTADRVGGLLVDTIDTFESNVKTNSTNISIANELAVSANENVLGVQMKVSDLAKSIDVLSSDSKNLGNELSSQKSNLESMSKSLNTLKVDVQKGWDQMDYHFEQIDNAIEELRYNIKVILDKLGMKWIEV